jgi:hypothetical protein
VIVLTALLPVGVAVLSAPSASDWWYAIVTYRGQGDSIVSGSPGARLSQFWDSLPEVARALSALAALAAVGWRRSPLLARLWLGAAALGVLGGGNFHAHYYVQLAPPLALLAGVGATRLLERRAGLAAGVCAGLALWGVVSVAPLWFDSPRAQAAAIFPADDHLQHDDAVIRYVRSHSRPGDRIFVMWAAANVYYLSDRDPAVPYMWFRNIQVVPGALDQVHAALASREPLLVVGEQPPGALDTSGETARLLESGYRLAANVGGVPIYRRR